MARFPRSGTNWEGRKWNVPPSLDALLDEIEAAYPGKRNLDATVASKAHDLANPTSDHRPKPVKGAGKVRAADIGEHEPEGEIIAEALRKSRDPRIRYVIHEGRIFSSYSTTTRKAWEWGKYSGANAHLTHAHGSVNESNQNDGKPWNLKLGGTTPEGYKVYVTRETIKQGSKGGVVEIAQSLLARAGHPPANTFDKNHKPDGIFGAGMDTAVRSFQKAKKLSVDGVIGPKTWAVLEAK